MNAEHGEENVQVKPHAYVHRQMSGSNLSEGFWCSQNIFSNTTKLKNSTIKKVKKLQKLIKEVQKKKKQNRVQATYSYMPRSIDVNVHTENMKK